MLICLKFIKQFEWDMNMAFFVQNCHYLKPNEIFECAHNRCCPLVQLTATNDFVQSQLVRVHGIRTVSDSLVKVGQKSLLHRYGQGAVFALQISSKICDELAIGRAETRLVLVGKLERLLPVSCPEQVVDLRPHCLSIRNL